MWFSCFGKTKKEGVFRMSQPLIETCTAFVVAVIAGIILGLLYHFGHVSFKFALGWTAAAFVVGYLTLGIYLSTKFDPYYRPKK
jgi:hypothetical protein